MKRTRWPGFTLLELLVVVIIIGILATIALPQFTRFIDATRETEVINIVGSILTGEFAAFQQNSTFTTDPTQLLVDLPPMRSWATPIAASFAAGNSSDQTVGGVGPGGDLTNAVTVTISGAAAPANGSGGHTHPDHEVRGIIVSNGARLFQHRGYQGDATPTTFENIGRPNDAAPPPPPGG